jgi:MoxR-like ATPase
VQVGASPRGGLALVQLARSRAVLSGRDYVVTEDVKAVAVPALAHRISLRPELWVRKVSADEVVATLLSSTPTPQTVPRAERVADAVVQSGASR